MEGSYFRINTKFLREVTKYFSQFIRLVKNINFIKYDYINFLLSVNGEQLSKTEKAVAVERFFKTNKTKKNLPLICVSKANTPANRCDRPGGLRRQICWNVRMVLIT